MGLDMIELVLSVEEEFDIYISDDTWVELQTPQDVADYINDEYLQNRTLGCPSQVGFYRVRKLLMEEFDIEREKITPTAKLQDLFQENIKTKWKKLNSLLDNKLAYYPLELNNYINAITFILITILSQYFINDFVLGLISILFIYPLSLLILRPLLGNKVPNELKQVSSLIKFKGESNATTKYKHPTSIMEKVIELTAEQFSVDSSRISNHTKFIELEG